MKLMQILLSQSEAGAETYFEKVAYAFSKDDSIQQRLVIEAQVSREKRLEKAGVDYRTLPMDKFGKIFLYNNFLKRYVSDFDPDLIVTWVNRASRKCPKSSAIVVGRLGGYYDINNYRKCDHLIVNTPDLVRHVVANGWSQDHVSMISNFGELPESLDLLEPIPSIPEGSRVLLTLGRLHVKKGQDILIKALPKIPNTTLLIAGDGELKDELISLARSAGVLDRVFFLGLRKDIRHLFDLADVCVFPSRFEPLGNVILEAWATKTPLVAAASQGPSWLVEHEKDGLLFEIDNVEQCAKQVNRVLNDRCLAAKIVEQGVQKFEMRFSMNVIINQYRQLFDQLINEKGKAGLK
ncbi:Glycosyltransferase involved in cell wall bisynthesis [Desulfuromusa kysingii]|uniref:Glycosyltransferase involved in cell wall bisynthesis n=1 Tax=Desulfuromusa kysingii TaxID=37625 RepID=A0A1H3YG80_9BACT|nr:glycosyltransferase [Desulfuromusa kysingii]SEA10526.1 Glycosyltransferase involved in cell wall bisynthesis [Desulfuromusa kysingii]